MLFLLRQRSEGLEKRLEETINSLTNIASILHLSEDATITPYNGQIQQAIEKLIQESKEQQNAAIEFSKQLATAEKKLQEMRLSFDQIKTKHEEEQQNVRF